MVFSYEALEPFLPAQSSAIARDLRLNLKRILEDGALGPEKGLLVLLATSQSVGYLKVAEEAMRQLKDGGMQAEQIQEARESAALMAMLNMYYRFRHMANQPEDYHTAGLRMTALSRPALGKETFEMLALAVSVLNGCQTCVASHEKVLREAGVTVDQVHDLARLSSVVKGLLTLSTI